MKILILLSFILQFNIQDNSINLKARLIEDFTRTPNCGTALVYGDYDFAVIQNSSIYHLEDTIVVRIYCPNDVLKEPLLKGNMYILDIKELKSSKKEPLRKKNIYMPDIKALIPQDMLKYELIDINEL